MIRSVRINQTVIKARITSGARQTVVSIKSVNRVKGFFVGIQGPKGADGATFIPGSGTRFTNFVGNGIAETTVTETPISLTLMRTVTKSS